jgi:hypothetical protein
MIKIMDTLRSKKEMKKYRFNIEGNGVERIMFMLFFTICCITVFLIPIAILALIQKIEIIES